LESLLPWEDDLIVDAIGAHFLDAVVTQIKRYLNTTNGAFAKHRDDDNQKRLQ
jgi:hypothetical protein